MTHKALPHPNSSRSALHPWPMVAASCRWKHIQFKIPPCRISSELSGAASALEARTATLISSFKMLQAQAFVSPCLLVDLTRSDLRNETWDFVKEVEQGLNVANEWVHEKTTCSRGRGGDHRLRLVSSRHVKHHKHRGAGLPFLCPTCRS